MRPIQTREKDEWWGYQWRHLVCKAEWMGPSLFCPKCGQPFDPEVDRKVR